MMVFFQAVVGKKKFLAKFEDGKKKEMRFFILYVYSKEEIFLDMDGPISYLAEK